MTRITAYICYFVHNARGSWGNSPDGIKENQMTITTVTATMEFSTKFGKFLTNYHDFGNVGIISLRHGDIGKGTPVVRIQSACLFGQSLHSLHCDCAAQLDDALSRVQVESGVIVFSPRGEGKGAGLVPKIRAMEMERTTGCASPEAYRKLGYPSGDLREFSLEAQVLVELGVSKRIRLLTVHEGKRRAVENAGFTIVT